MKEFQIHSVETKSEVSQKSNVKIVTYINRKTLSKGPGVQFKEFSLTKQKLDLEWTMSEFPKKNQMKKLKNRKSVKLPQKSDQKN